MVIYPPFHRTGDEDYEALVTIMMMMMMMVPSSQGVMTRLLPSCSVYFLNREPSHLNSLQSATEIDSGLHAGTIKGMGNTLRYRSAERFNTWLDPVLKHGPL